MVYFRSISIFLVAFTLNVASAGNAVANLANSHSLFAMDMIKTVSLERSNENVIFSPASIQSCLALALLGAGGKTAQQLRNGIRLPDKQTKQQIAKDYANFIKKNFNGSPQGKKDAPQLRMATRIYVNDKFKLSPKFNELAKTSFNAEAAPANFAKSALAVKTINAWVEKQTNGKIENLLAKDDVFSDTGAVLVNAIYFKNIWLIKASKAKTSKKTFKMSGQRTAMVDMMNWKASFKYADLSDLDAKAIEMRYKNSDLSMLIVLPKKVDGLKALEKKLVKVDLNQISEKMRSEYVIVQLPKFRIEFAIDLKEPMQKLGMTDMFSNAADFTDILASKTQLKVSKIKHKAFIEVNEDGTVAAAATLMILRQRSSASAPPAWKDFVADHPFVFAIRNREAVHFMGHVAKF